MNNKTIGNSFETELCDVLSQNGFWAHNFANRSYGQPADIIAVRHNAYLIDAKVISGKGGFNTERIEDNQHDSMCKWLEVCCTTPVFIIKLSLTGEIFVGGYPQIVVLAEKTKTIPQKKLRERLMTLEEWLECIS